MHDEDWLPPGLLKEMVELSRKVGKWSLEAGEKGTRTLVCSYDEKTTWRGTFTLGRTGRVGRVSVDLAGKGGATVAVRKPTGPASAGAATRPRDEGTPTTRPTTRMATVDPVRSAINMAKVHEANKDKAKARAVLERALKENPDSPASAEARAILQKLK